MFNNLTPDQMVMIGVALVGMMLGSFHPKVQEILKSVLGKVNPLKIFTPTERDDLLIIDEITTPEEVHEVVSGLIEYFKKQNDVEGIKCCVKIGNHIYEHQLQDAIEVKPLTIAKE